MIHSSKMLAAAVLTGFGLALAGAILAATGDARAVPMSTAHERIAAAFSSVAPIAAAPAIEIAAREAGKGDLFAGSACAGRTWPEIGAGCLVTASGRPSGLVRYVTVGYQAGGASSVLMRMPAPQVASR